MTTIPTPGELLDFSGRVVVVTGGGRGIGAGIALRFAEAGAAVVVHYHTSATAALEIVGAIEAMGRAAVAVQANVTRQEDTVRLMGAAVQAFGRLDTVINNAGTYPLASVLEMTEAEWDGVVDSNLRSVFLCTQAAARQMVEQGEGGTIVNIASVEATHPAPLHSHYNAAKAGVVMHTRSAAQELGQFGIRVNAVSPGLIWRAGIETQWPEGVERWQASAPLERLGRPEDVADACLFLASPAARWVTGHNLVVDGGVSARSAF